MNYMTLILRSQNQEDLEKIRQLAQKLHVEIVKDEDWNIVSQNALSKAYDDNEPEYLDQNF